MTPEKIERLEASLNAVARKVLECVPLDNAATVGQICAQLCRTGHNIAPSTVEGCLRQAVQLGIAREPRLGIYRRIGAKPREESPRLQAVDTRAEPPAIPPPASTLLDRIAQLGADVRRHSAEGEALASRVDDLAVEVEETFARLREEGETIRKLKQLLSAVN